MTQKKQINQNISKKIRLNYKKLHAKYRPLLKRQIAYWKKLIKKPAFAKKYVFFALAVLLATTVLWAVLGASIESRNSDQLVDGYLFAHASTLHGAYLPGSHSFLIKWPLFAMIGAFGASNFTITIFTVAVVLVTVAILALLIRSFEKRPLVFGTYCLALACVTLLVPAQPYPGGLLPINMAMITTRNLEYVLYIASLVLFVKFPKIKSLGFWLATGCLSLLIASDRLFLVLSIGGSIFALIAYACTRQLRLIKFLAKWLALSLIAGISATVILWLINWSGLTHIVSRGNSGPYQLTHSAHGVALGIIFAILGILTNFGANPAFDITVLRNIPHQVLTRLSHPEGITFIINAVILAIGVYAVWQIISGSLKKNQKQSAKGSNRLIIPDLLIWSSVAAVFSYIFTNHYYAADSRYLTISLFAVFISASAYFKNKKIAPEKLVLAGLVISAGILLGIPTVTRTYSADKAALSNIDGRNLLVAQAMNGHPDSVLVGDYWRVIPTKSVSSKPLDVMPLSDCTTPLTSLTSSTWNVDLSKHSFAYLLSLDHGLTTYPDCTLSQITNIYGRPNSSFLIAGSLAQPKELLLFYDQGKEKNRPNNRSPQQETSSVLPIPLAELPHTKCPSGHTVMNIVAHQDDDLLFLSPDLIHDIKAGYCIRTIYITAGDGGFDSSYWLGREQGSQVAYSTMSGQTAPWIQRVVELTNQEYIRVANPQKNDYISLISLRLPDGGLKGQGFKASHYESLAKLEFGKISSIHSVTGQSVFTSNQLIDALVMLINAYQPSEIHTQSMSDIGSKFSDHSDHMAVGGYVSKAYRRNTSQTPSLIKFYLGYSGRQMPANVSGTDFQEKQAAFLAYSQFDGAVCHSPAQCKGDLTYGSYLARQYSRAY